MSIIAGFGRLAPSAVAAVKRTRWSRWQAARPRARVDVCLAHDIDEIPCQRFIRVAAHADVLKVDHYQIRFPPGLPIMRLDLRSFGSKERLYRALFEDNVFVRWIDKVAFVIG